MKPLTSSSVIRPTRQLSTKQPSLLSTIWPLMVVLAGALLAMLVVRIPQESQIFAYALVLGCVIVLLGISKQRRSGSTLGYLATAPTGFPLAYTGFVLLAPLIFALITNESTGPVSTNLITPKTILISLATVSGFAIGIYAPLNEVEPTKWLDANRSEAIRLAALARATLLASLVSVVGQVVLGGTVITSAYGASQTAFGISQVLATATGAALLVGCALLFHSKESLGEPLIPMTDLVLLTATLFINTVLLGSRAEIIPTALLFIWYWVKSGRRLSATAIIAALLACMALFSFIARFRTIGQGIASNTTTSMWKQSLVELSGPVVLSKQVSQLVPSMHEFYNGSTYWAALAALPPGIVRLAFGIEIGDTGAFAYRNLIGYTNQDNGFGFAFPAEAYMNFGIFGVFIAAAILGIGFNIAYSHAFRRVGVLGYLYPIMLATLPYGLRSDALTQLKSTVYPLMIIAICIGLSQSRRRKERHR